MFHAFPTKLRGGFVGVDIFFVISGFLISSIIFRSLLRGDFSFTEFYAHRIKRIFPALLLVLTASYVFGWLALLPEEFKQLGKHIVAGTGFVQNIVLWKEAGYFDTASEFKPLMHLWSLAIEEQFYLFYPLLIWGAWRLGLNVLAIVVVLGLLSFGLNVHDIGKDAVKTFFLPQTRFWELFAGALLAYLQLFKRTQLTEWLKISLSHRMLFRSSPLPHQREAVINNLLASLGLLLIVAAIFGLNKGKLFPGWWALFPIIGAVCLILAGTEAWVNRKILANRFMVWVGLISYPLYLWHWTLLSFAHIIESETPLLAIRIAAVALSFLLAWLTYWLLEKPIRFGKNTWVKTALLSVLAAMVGFAGYNAYQRDGLEFRQKHFLSQTKTQFDLLGASNEACQRYSSLKFEHCLHSNVIPPTILLVGDSHTGALRPGLTEVASNATSNILSVAGGGCLSFFDVASFQIGEKEICADQMNSALAFAEQQASIKLIVMAFRGPLYLTGKGLGGIEKGYNRNIKLAGQPDMVSQYQVFETAMRATLTRLAHKKQIVFVLDVPEMGFHPRLCVDNGLPLHFNSRTKLPCAVPRQNFEARNREYRTLVLAVLKDFPSVKVFDAAAPLCDEEWCWAMKNGKFLYQDDDHLSVEGSRLIAKELVKLIDTH